ncbi:MAG: hypothetical protein LBR23_01305 [Spirochaetaceae bacterium]|jgi:hypothetical protein|nr:hypothetical protein [Spirochaetaceae bacterium]
MCWKCGTAGDFPPPVSRSEVCPRCGADIRSCRNCTFFLPGAHYDCKETVDEPVADKERANFCGFFSYDPLAGKGAAQAGLLGKAEKAASDFNALFSP